MKSFLSVSFMSLVKLDLKTIKFKIARVILYYHILLTDAWSSS